MTIKTILHPTDFSPGAEPAFLQACLLAEANGARLIVLHVVAPTISPLSAEPRPAESQAALKRRYSWPQPANPRLPVEYRVAEGDFADEIVAQGASCEMIVMGTHGRTGLQRLMLGSVAEQVLRRASCPVMTVKMPANFVPSVRYFSAARECAVVDAGPLGVAAIISSSTRTHTTLFKTDEVEIARLVVPERVEIAELTRGDTIVQCLEGSVSLTAYSKVLILAPGQLLFLPREEYYHVKGLKDASLLMMTYLAPV